MSIWLVIALVLVIASVGWSIWHRELSALLLAVWSIVVIVVLSHFTL